MMITRDIAAKAVLEFLSKSPQLWRGLPVDLKSVELIDQSFANLAAHEGFGFLALLSNEKFSDPVAATSMGIDLSKLLTFASRKPAFLLGKFFVERDSGMVRVL